MTSASDPTTRATTSGALAAALDRPVVSTQWLADHLGSEGLVVLDATVVPSARADGSHGYLSGLDQFLVDGHVPSAVFAELLDVFSDPAGAYPFTRPSAAAFEAAAASVGIDNDTTVVVYDASVGQWASRIWWLFRAFGYDRVAVLDGGIAKWRTEERVTDRGHVEPREGASFDAVERPGSWVEKDIIAAVVEGSETATLICAVPPKEFTGEAGQRPRLGHIPGSLSVPAARLVSRETNAYLPFSDLRAIFADALASQDPIVVYCAGGIAAASDALALALLGRSDVAIYDGSLNEWSTDADAPLVTIAA
ncbi:sulfurtransferase [Leifsonia poae]|uniref:sulfurtransferase n=1 Tax=Leifsonia poae TaxID=110933 RepID=UPI003D67088C